MNKKQKFWFKALMWTLIFGSVLSVFITLIYTTLM